MTIKKEKLIIMEERPDKLKIKFSSVDFPIEVSKRYFEKLKQSDSYKILRRKRETLLEN
ncbi:MAG: hypothetical protein AAF573_12355 [Bacteroidota bacterium]